MEGIGHNCVQNISLTFFNVFFRGMDWLVTLRNAARTEVRRVWRSPEQTEEGSLVTDDKPCVTHRTHERIGVSVLLP